MHDDDKYVNPHAHEGNDLNQLIKKRISRRKLLEGTLIAGAAATLPVMAGCESDAIVEVDENAGDAAEMGRFLFQEIQRGSDQTHHVPEGYQADVLLRWGDPLFMDAPVFDPYKQSATAQSKQFGYNCDFVGFHPLPVNVGEAPRGLLCVNHEYTSTALMFPGVAAGYPGTMTAQLCEIEKAAHGGSVVEIEFVNGQWQVVLDSQYNRRVMAKDTPMQISGPAAGSPRLAIGSDPEGRVVDGTLNNCAGGITAWGTYLMSEENFHGYFQGQLDQNHAESVNHERYGVPSGWFQWGRFDDNFNVDREPNAPNRYGWVVEVDILNPSSAPKKRTALGRLKHEGAESVINSDGRVVVYMGDDERFEYVYKFVSEGRFDPENRDANLDLLDHGTLYVAKFSEDGSLTWLPLTHGQGPLTADNGFASQADVVIEARRAADLLEATPMDRPEDVEAQPETGKVYVMLTNNTRREADDLNAANPRANNAYGHIIEITCPDADHTAETGRWEMLIQAGDPTDASVQAKWNPATSAEGWFGSPDNCAFDPAGRMWVATDGNPATGAADGLWGVETQGPLRGTGYAFFRAPVGAEVCGPRFTPNGKTLFLSIQHPGDGSEATFESPTTRWPDFDEALPPRPSVIAISRQDGGAI